LTYVLPWSEISAHWLAFDEPLAATQARAPFLGFSVVSCLLAFGYRLEFRELYGLLGSRVICSGALRPSSLPWSLS